MSVEVSMGVFGGNALVPTWDEFVRLRAVTAEFAQGCNSKFEELQAIQDATIEGAQKIAQKVECNEKNILERLKDIDECIGKLENRINNDLPAIVGKSADLAWKEFSTLLSAVKTDMDIIIGINNGKLVVVESEAVGRMEKIIDGVKSENKKLENIIDDVRSENKKLKRKLNLILLIGVCLLIISYYL